MLLPFLLAVAQETTGQVLYAQAWKPSSQHAGPDTPRSPEGNTEGPGTASSEPLLPS